jgi:hypothetical protein
MGWMQDRDLLIAETLDFVKGVKGANAADCADRRNRTNRAAGTTRQFRSAEIRTNVAPAAAK